MATRIDCRGLQCPAPVLRCRETVAAEHPKALQVLVDNQAALENVSRFLRQNGYEVSQKEEAGQWLIEATGTGQAQASSDSGSEANTLILIASETLGHGDDHLGAKLMENFLSTLPELTGLWRIVFVNGGVKLTVQDSPVLASLQKLVQLGVEILVCGTCLMHFGLMEQKRVGETTNMLDIVTAMGVADKVIRP